ncbi:MAG: hypothetical protein ACE5KV_08435, partial [Thermoplasmata archaeon]
AGISIAIVQLPPERQIREVGSSANSPHDFPILDVSSTSRHVHSPNWDIQTVDPSGAGTVDLAVDGSGRPHLAYSHGDYVRHAVLDGRDWIVTDVKSSESTLLSQVGIAIDMTGTPHIIYWEFPSRHKYTDFAYLRHAWLEGDEWVEETFGYDDYLWSDIVLDKLGRVHLVYSVARPPGDHYFTTEELWYAVEENGYWSVERIDSNAGWLGGCPSIVVDNSNSPHVVYQAYTGKEDSHVLRYASKGDEKTWNVETIGRTESCPSIFLDGLNQPHIVHKTESDGPENSLLIYLHKEDDRWVGEIMVKLDLSGDQYVGCAGSISLFLDQYERPHVAYYHWTDEDFAVKYAFRGEEGWIIDSVESGSQGIGGYLTLALDGKDIPHLAYYRWDSWAVVYATKQEVKPHLRY